LSGKYFRYLSPALAAEEFYDLISNLGALHDLAAEASAQPKVEAAKLRLG